jgi:hypothetical protein
MMCGCGLRQPYTPTGPPPSRSSISHVVSPPTLKISAMTRRVSSTSLCGHQDIKRDTSGSDVIRSNSASASSIRGARRVTRGPVSTSTSVMALSWQ